MRTHVHTKCKRARTHFIPRVRKFSMYFAYFLNLSIKVPPKFEKYVKSLGIFGNTTSKCTCITKILPYMRGMRVVLGPCIHLKLYISFRMTPFKIAFLKKKRIKCKFSKYIQIFILSIFPEFG